MSEKTNQPIDLTEKVGALWCGMMHDSPSWPIHGKYYCRTCGRLYHVPWTAHAGTDRSLYVAGVAQVHGSLNLEKVEMHRS